MSNRADPAGLLPRKAALRLVGGVISDRKLLPELIGAGALDHLVAENRARAQRLATTTLRNLGRADAVLRPHLRKRPPLAVTNALRMGTIELAEGAAAHGVVNAYVTLIGQGKRTASYRGLTNAVLRKVADDAPARWDQLPSPKLPRWLRDPLIEAWGKRAVAAMEATWSGPPPVDLTPRTDGAALAEAVNGQILPNGSVRLTGAIHVSALPGYDEGAFWVQDAAAAMPATLLEVQSGERVLDMCAAPGGKTLQLAALGADVVAIDASEARLERLHKNLERTGLTAKVVAADARTFSGGPFDAILLDAPCSATGTLRRHPDLPLAKDGSEFSALFELQAQLIDHAISLLRPGGRLVYCTCSLLPDEGEVQIEEALARHPNVTARPDSAEPAWLDPAWRTEEGGVRPRPDYWQDLGGMDGFYIACLQKGA